MFELILRADKVVHVIVALLTVSRSVPQHTERAIFELRPGIRMHPSRETLPEQHISTMLKVYLQKAYEEVGLASDAEGTTIQDLAAELKSNAENLILVYSGAFNPPHQGHVDVIRSGLRLDLAAVAIVILPSDDQYAKDKVVGKHPYFFLNQRRRADIWQASALFPKTRVWVWRNTKPLFYSFAESLLRLTKTDSYKLEFGRLDGPDNLNIQNPFAYVYREGFRRMVVTNKARHLQSHFGPDNKPLKWNGCGDWSVWQGSPDGEYTHQYSVAIT